MFAVCVFYIDVFAGTNVEKAREILRSSGLAITPATDLTDAAQKAVASL